MKLTKSETRVLEAISARGSYGTCESQIRMKQAALKLVRRGICKIAQTWVGTYETKHTDGAGYYYRTHHYTGYRIVLAD